jgi:Ca2+-binding EF-hand superfamily protein
MCQDKNINRAKLTRGKFKAFLSIRYKGVVAEKIKTAFKTLFSAPIEYEFYCDLMERLLNPLDKNRIFRIAHSLYDFDDDGRIDELDTYCFYTCFEAENSE